MAYFDRVHGDSKPVFQSDTLDPTYSNPTATGTPVNPFGPHLDFFGISLNNGSLVDQMGTGGAVEAVLKCIQQLATVAIYQAEDDNSNNLSVAVYPVGAWDTGTLSSAIVALGTVNGFDLTNVDVYNDGFRLWF